MRFIARLATNRCLFAASYAMRRWRASPGGSSNAATASVRAYVVRGSGATVPACTARASVAEWDTEPLLPCAVIVKFPVAALDAAPKTRAVLVPDAMLNGLAGFETTPLGTPASVTWIVPVKSFWPATETVIGALVPPCETDREFEESVIAKSGEGVGGGWTI